MKSALLPMLACPSCSGSLHLHPFLAEAGVGDEPAEDVVEGVLVCYCGAAYPVFEGVPRLVEGALSLCGAFIERWRPRLGSVGALTERALRPPSAEFRRLIAPTMERFGKEWGEHPLGDTTWGLDQQTRLLHALRYLGWREEEAWGKAVLDAGCGTGKLTCGMARWGGEVVGLDVAPALVRGWRERRTFAGQSSGHVHMVQGNLTQPPLRRESFDAIHCSGVLHHTPDTRATFRAVASLVKPGGVLAVWLYRADRAAGRVPWLPFVRAPWASIPIPVLRRLTPRLPPSLLYGVILFYASAFHVVYWAGAALRGRRHSQTVRGRVTSLFDSLAPPHVWQHTPEEVTAWFLDAGFAGIRETTAPGETEGFCITGVRPPT